MKMEGGAGNEEKTHPHMHATVHANAYKCENEKKFASRLV